MLPEDWEYGPWPLSGEIDIVECRGENEKIFHHFISLLSTSNPVKQVPFASCNTVVKFKYVKKLCLKKVVLKYLDLSIFFNLQETPTSRSQVELTLESKKLLQPSTGDWLGTRTDTT